MSIRDRIHLNPRGAEHWGRWGLLVFAAAMLAWLLFAPSAKAATPD